MKNFKKTIALVLCLVLSLGTFANAEEAVLISSPIEKDYEGHWAQATIQKWLEAGKVSGYPDGSYKPDSNVTRAEFVKMLNGVIDFNKKAAITYKDVPASEWFYDYIGVAQAVGYISGYSLDKFGPNDYITREQAASILSRVQYLDNNESSLQKFIDNSSISSWAKGSVGAASNAGFIAGYTDKSFKPLNNLTRAEALTMIDNVLVNGKNYIVYNDGTELKDTIIEGDLIIAKTVGEGDVHLTNVEVKGEIKVFGGGMNSVYFNNVKVAKIIVEKDKVRLVFDDGSTVDEIEVTSEVVLENEDGTIAKITVSGDDEITLKGNFDEVAITGNANVVLDDVVITNLVVTKSVVIQGTGTIKTLQADADGIKFEADVKIEKTLVGTGVTVEPEKIVEAPSGGGGGGGGVIPTKYYKISVSAIFDDVDYGELFTTDYYNGTANITEFITGEIADLLNEFDPEDSNIDEYINRINSKLEYFTVKKFGGGDDIQINTEPGLNEIKEYFSEKNILTGIDDNIFKDSIVDVSEIKNILTAYKQADIVSVGNFFTNIKFRGNGLSYKVNDVSKDTEGMIEIGSLNINSFFTQYPSPVTLKITSGSNNATITITRVE